MQAPPIIQPSQVARYPGFFILTGFAIVVVALLSVGYFLHEFYVGTASFTPGTEIRPMGLTGVLGLSAIISTFAGGGFAVVGLVKSLKLRRWWLALAALITIGLCWTPWTISYRGFHHIVDLRQLVLEE